jgi:ribonuclease I
LCFNNFQKSIVFNHSGNSNVQEGYRYSVWRDGACSVFSPHRQNALKATQYGDFDRYVLALSWQTGFCQSMVERNRNEPDECRLQKESDNKTDFLTVHGLWPGLPKSIAARVDERRWMRFGCATRPFRTCRK